MRLVSIVEYKAKRRTMKVFSNQPGIQFYTGNFLPRSGMKGKVNCNAVPKMAGKIKCSHT